ncbi:MULTISPECIES: fumarylacetoacetate hydrolase family protein [Prauserella salsuginis group]|uniref:Fumarylacetoacetate hydrolase family protein n=1 Tax=Prauserella salsuginis TaxID=387889 RepID=A0ABW6G0Y8_9PSEU|nr:MULTISPECIES: fumarylacetoacetate hydrolase family protein [Prauserella salsuginis group]MCR3722015.1 2-keto-4-pentenoate hydratase/2-oxohepta-3-ene-1,7-dioic acid hydratase (catechol pathway) [Prauserella flava]MCR3736021.1 2-keto-4-pentenoate hydratase/2-oxohepta-3-ene-1,7-dioic acid hydratase (catechol pathway) [Prauserella salsuginis]
MKLVTYSAEAGDRVGVIDSEAGVVRDVSGLLPVGFGVIGVIEHWAELGEVLAANATTQPATPLHEVTLRAPIPRPRRNVFCVGKNYKAHVAEFGRSGYDTPSRSEELPQRPVVFSKATTSVTGPYDVVGSHPDVTAELDYEGELAVIIGRGGLGISRDDAFDHVWGYTIVNDVTARDVQRDHKQWLLGKSLDTHCPMGPYAVTADEITDVAALELETTVNGETRQLALVKDLIFDIPDLISTISGGITLEPGDVIATGTPAGVGIGFDPPQFLNSGDVVEVSISNLGKLRNRIQ